MNIEAMFINSKKHYDHKIRANYDVLKSVYVAAQKFNSEDFDIIANSIDKLALSASPATYYPSIDLGR